MAQNKADRFASARELASEIQAFRDGRALSSYSYSTAESVKRWVGRHKAAVLTAMLALSVIITGSVFAFVELEKEKSAAVQGQTAAVASQQRAEAATELAESESKAASEARAEAESAARSADRAAGRATEAEKTARTEAERSTQLLSKLRHALAEDYAVRVQVSQGRGDYNSAYAYAAACLKTIDHAVARGAIMSDGQVIPRVWQFEPDEVTTQDIHEFYALAVSPDSRFVATGTQSGKVVIWNLKTGEKVQTLELNGKQVFAVAFHPCEPVLIAASARDQIVAYRYSDEKGSFQLDREPIGVGSLRVTSLEFSPDGQVIALGGDRLHLLSWPEFTVLDAPKTGDYTPMIARFSPDGKRMTTTSLLPSLAFGDATIWDIKTEGSQRRTIPSNRWELFSAWSPDSKYVATAGFGGEITIREADKMSSKGVVLRGHTSTVLQVNYSPSGKYLASASADGTVRLWSTHTGRSIAVLSGFPTWVQSVLFSPGETLLLLRDIQGRVSVWDIREFDRNSLRAHSDDVIDIDYSPDGSSLATASIDGRISLIASKTKEVVKTMGVGAEPFLSVAFVPGKERLLAGNMRGLYVYDYGVPGARLETPTTVLARNATILDVAVSPDASHFAFVQYQRLVVYNAQTLSLIGNIELEGFALSCAFSPSGDEVAVGCRDGSLTICDVKSGSTEVFRFEGKSVFAVAYSPDGTYVAVSSEANGLSIFDTQKRQTVHTIPHSAAVFGVDFSADGKLLVSGSQDRLVRVISTSDWKILAILSGPESVVTRVAVHPNGQQVVAGSQDDTVRFWSLRSLSAKRQNLLTIAEGKTGLAVDDETLTVIQLANWPMVDGHVSSVVKSVRARAELEIDKAERAFVYRYEHFRYLDSDGQRVYLPPRKRDAFGNYSGELRGKIDHASWFRSKVDAAPRKWFWRKAFVTEITEGGQAEKLEIKAGDVIWTVNDKWVRSKETLTEAMKAKQEKVEITLRRFERDEDGLRIPLQSESGVYILDELGRMQWRHKVITATFSKGKLGLKVNYDDFLKQPVHRKSKR
jgi:WD40 repeat protein